MTSVLIVDNDPNSRELSRLALRPLGCEIVDAADGKSGLYLAGLLKPSLLLVDVRLPKLDGFGLLRALRNNPETADMRVVAFTASVMTGDKEAALAAGFDGFIAKPVAVKQLRTEVRGFLDLFIERDSNELTTGSSTWCSGFV